MAEKRPRLAVEDSVAEEPQAGEAGRSEGDVPSPEEPTTEDAREEVPAWQLGRALRQAVQRHEKAVAGGLVGLCVAVLVFALGLWRALFVVFCVAVGVAVGQGLDGDTRVLDAIKRALRGNQG